MAILRGLFWHASFVFGTIASDCILPAMSNSSENPHKYYFFQVLYWLHLWLAFCLELTVYPLVNIRNGLFLTCLLMKILLPIVSTAVPPLRFFFLSGVNLLHQVLVLFSKEPQHLPREIQTETSSMMFCFSNCGRCCQICSFVHRRVVIEWWWNRLLLPCSLGYLQRWSVVISTSY